MSHRAMTWAVGQQTGSPARKAVLMNLADRADAAWSCWPGQKLIAKDTELGERTVRRALDDLETAGLIRRRHHRRKDGSWTSDRYVLAGIDTDPDAKSLLADENAGGQSGRRDKSHSAPLLADAGTGGHSGRRSERPQATAAVDPAATAAGHEPSVTNPHSHSPSESERAPAHEDAAEQLPLVDAPAEPVKAKRRVAVEVPIDWTPSPGLCDWTSENYPGMPRSEVAAFVDKHRSVGNKFLDLDAAWRTWCRNWKKYGARGSGGPVRPRAYTDDGWKDGTSAASWDRLKETGGQDR